MSEPRLDEGIGTADLTYRELRDVLWLSGKLRPDADGVEAAEPTAPTPPVEALETDAGKDRTDAGQEVPAEQEPEPEPPGLTRIVALGEGSDVVPLGWPAHAALPDARGIARALRPFMRTTPSPWRTVLDEEGTAVRAAQDGLWVPEWKPAPWRRFDVALVTDVGSSMDIWRGTAREFLRLLQRQGAFRDVRHYRLDCSKDSPEDLLLQVGGTDKTWQWSHLVEPAGGRMVLVLTDTVGPAWRNGAAAGLLARWGRTMPVAVVQVLPHRLWHWSALTTRRVRLSARRSGAANRHLRVKAVQPDADIAAEELKNAVPVPVLGLSPDWMAGWAKLLTSDDGGWIETTATLVSPADGETTPAIPNEPAALLSARDRVLRFRSHASVEAFSLAGLLADLLAAEPLSLPLMTLVQRRLLPGSSPSALAEVMVGGLLKQVPPAGRVEGDAPTITYDFYEGVREELLSTAVPAPEPTDENRPHLRVRTAVLRALSGPYAPRALRLARAREEMRPASYESDAIMGEVAHAMTSAAAEPPIGEHDLYPVWASVGRRRETTGQPSVWGSVPFRNPDFVGRADVLRRLRERLSEPGVTAVVPEALHGMGGIGKSQTVVEYIYRHAAEYDVVWWIRSEHPSQITASLVELARRLGLPAGSADIAVPAVLEALRTGTPLPHWILVFDNADRPEFVRPFFPVGNGHIVVTSRNPDWAGVARPIEVDLFTRAESVELLRRRDVGISEEDADRLAEALGDLPLAVEQAAAWRAQTLMPVAEYLELFNQHRMELLGASSNDYEVPVAAAWNVSLVRLKQEHPEALRLLQVCAFLGPEPIFRSWFIGVRGASLPDELAPLRDPMKLARAMRAINRYGLAKIDHGNDTLQLHRLLQAVLRSRLDAEEQDRFRHAAHVLLARADPNDPENPVNWSSYSDVLPHALASRGWWCEDFDVRLSISNLVRYLLASGDHGGALDLSQDAVHVLRQHLGESSVETIEMTRLFAIALRRLGRVEEAVVVNEKNLERVREAVGEDHEMWLTVLGTVAADRRTQGKFAEELELRQNLYDRSLELFGQDDLTTLSCAHDLASCQRLMGEFVKARELDAENLRRREIVLGEHPSTYRARNALAVDLRECGDHEDARRLQQETLSRQREELGPDHPHTIGAARNLAVTLRRLGDHAGALELSHDCAAWYRHRYGDRHVDTAISLSSLSVDLRHTGDLRRALEAASAGYRLFREIRGDGHPYTLLAATNLASVRRSRGDLRRARDLDELAERGLCEALGSDHPFALVAAANLASDLAVLRALVQSRVLNEDLVRRSARVLGEEHPTTLAIELNLSLDLRQDGADAEAESLHARTVDRFVKVLGVAHPATIAAREYQRAICDADTMEL
ncbi:FxSxx-COOH system tetratricopeptide repeat protein [Lentzea kentuckyensis]|uniref:FxSxx-COOH system tetratricopeptide repeat protein n=1 Tax=Lentzea kentuckyensis TaxID=360086 RepID=UPI000A3A5512|nr:FxSxx-COOH system tetratricopeptide repeat protein [Lentzea kentuckyensis]